MASLFISYSRKDKEAAHKLTEAFKGPDLDFWIDWDDIPPSVDWWKEIEKGIEEADIFLFLLSPDSGSSRVCRQEIEHAVKNGKRLIPVVVRNVPASEAPPELRVLNWIYLREEDNFRAGFSKLIQAIKTDYAWVQVHRRLQVRALEWEKKNDRSLLLRGNDLRQAEEQLATSAHKDPQPTDVQRQYVLESRRRESRTRNSLLVIGALVIVALVFLSLFAFDQNNRANANERTAVANEQKAKEQANIALARQLSAQAQQLFTTQNSKQQTAVLLALQSLRLYQVEGAERFLQEDTLAKPVAHMVHDDLVESAALSLDGKYVASGSDDHTARVWEAETGKEIARMNHDANVLSVAFSPDDQYIVSGSADGTILVWEALAGKEISQMKQEGGVDTVSFSPDGKHVASGSDDHTIRVWEIATGKEVSRMTVDDRVTMVVYSPGGNYIASGSDDGITRVWEATTGQVVSRRQYSNPVTALAFSADGAYVASGSSFDSLSVWEPGTGKRIAEIGIDGTVYAIAFSPDGKYVVSGGCVEKDIQVACLKGSVSLWEIATGKEQIQIPQSSIVHQIAFSPDGKYLVSGSEDGVVRLLDATTGKEILRMTHEAKISSVAFSPDGRFVVSAGDNTVRVWRTDIEKEIVRVPYDDSVTARALSAPGSYIADAACEQGDMSSACLKGYIRVREIITGREVARLALEGAVTAMTFSPDEKYLGAASSQGPLRVWKLDSASEIAQIPDGTGVSVIAFSPNGNYVAATDSQETTHVWEVSAGREIDRMSRDPDLLFGVHWLDFSPDNKYLILGCYDGSARVREIARGKEIVNISNDDAKLSAIAISPDGKYVASAGLYSIRLWEIATGRLIVTKTHEALQIPAEIDSLAFSPNGKYVVSAALDNTAKVWDALTGVDISHVTHGIEHTRVHAAFSPDSRYVVSGSDDHSILIWETLTGQVIAHFLQSEYIDKVQFSSNGRYILSEGVGTVHVWVYRPEDLINETCSRVTRNLTYDEWNTYIGDAIPYPTRQEEETCPNLPIEPAVTATPPPTP